MLVFFISYFPYINLVSQRGKSTTILGRTFFYSDSRAAVLKSVSRCGDEPFPIAIVGGGLGGTALAVALQLKNIPVRVFEKDSCFNARSQGYGLTNQQGIMTLRNLGIESLMGGLISKSHESYDADGNMLGHYGHKKDLLPTNSDDEVASHGVNIIRRGRHNVHIPRQRLREILIEKLEKNVIQWNKRLIDYEDTENENGVILHFDDLTSFQSSVLIAADGIHSFIRQKKLPQSKLEYLGLIVILGISKNNLCSNTKERLVRQWLDGTTRIFAMPYDLQHTMWQLSFPVDENTALKLQGNSYLLKKLAWERCGHWHPDASSLLQHAEEYLITGYPVYDRVPVEVHELRGSPLSRVTMIGKICYHSFILYFHSNTCIVYI